MFRPMRWMLAAALLGCAHTPIPTGSTSAITNALRAGAPPTPGDPPEQQPRRTPCALPSLAQAPSEELLIRFGTGLERYQLEGGAWLPGAPVLVNEDFDFAIAMAMGPLGAGLAAGKRKDANLQKVSALAGVALSADILAQLDALRSEGVHAYFVLWGAEDAVLRLVMERNAACEQKTEALVLESAPRPLTAWGQSEALDAEARALMERADAASMPASSVPGPP